ncbi:MAG: hypothetical protein JWN03_1866 [Nocardia sp.]|uniref:VOC family protein n=1 Tax=Nocardia sp. TaxID=1821 RepID=UPI0026171F7D|nr:VOC family protein [Nocardia sp.]MCU1641591.1 hypothetical protein [Nocardia sp.]
MPFIPCLGVADTAASKNFFERLGFTVDSQTAGPDDDLHMLVYQGSLCAMLFSRAHLDTWLPTLASLPGGFSGMFYLEVQDFDATYARVREHATVVKDVVTDLNGVREFYISDIDGYVIGFNDGAARAASATVGHYATS